MSICWIHTPICMHETEILWVFRWFYCEYFIGSPLTVSLMEWEDLSDWFSSCIVFHKEKLISTRDHINSVFWGKGREQRALGQTGHFCGLSESKMSKSTMCGSLVSWCLDYEKDVQAEALSFDKNNLIVSIKLCSFITCLNVLVLYINYKNRQMECSMVSSRCFVSLLERESLKAAVQKSRITKFCVLSWHK